MDPMLSLSHSVYSAPGVYAVLIGSGVSRSAGIPTGWELTLGLVRRLANMLGEVCDPSPEEWYRKRYGKEADYSDVLDEMARTPAERREVLHSFFEPTDDERDQGIKLPTAAHQSVAKLVASGHIKVIVTTNFDRLMEIALQQQGVTPVVISTTDAIIGAAPLVHQRCVLVKVHGDYLDDRIKNTKDELSRYEAVLDDYLDAIFRDFGLIVCGWSADWDPALRSAIERRASRRYSMYWATRGSLGKVAAKLVDLHQGNTIDIQGADQFFAKLEEQVTALTDASTPSPVSVAAAVAAAKRYLSEDRLEVRLSDLLVNEAQSLNNKFSEEMLPNSPVPNPTTIKERMMAYDVACEAYTAMLFHLGMWAKPSQFSLVRRAISVMRGRGEYVGLVRWLDMRQYPQVLSFYAACFGAEVGENYELMNNLFSIRLRSKEQSGNLSAPILPTLSAEYHWDLAEPLFNEKMRTPMSEHLLQVLGHLARPYVHDPVVAFERTEVLMALHVMQVEPGEDIPTGRFSWNWRGRVAETLMEEVRLQGASWPPLRAGMLGGETSDLEDMIANFGNELTDMRKGMREF